jgi:hypothetical protein
MKRILSIFDFGNVFNLSLSYVLINFLEHIENNNDAQVKNDLNFMIK